MIDHSTRPLLPRTARSQWDNAVRLTGDLDPSIVLVQLGEMAFTLTKRWGCHISISVEPDGDACDTGHWVEIEAENGALWADMTPWPSRFGGALPHQLDTELDLAGWVLRRPSADPDPIDCVCEMPEFMTQHQLAVRHLPVRRLITFADDGDLASWSRRVVDAVDRVLAPRSKCWYLSGNTRALVGGPLSSHPRNRRGEFFDLWTLDLGAVLDDTSWERAMWPAYSEGAYIVCRKGFHQYHEPPCFLPEDSDPLG